MITKRERLSPFGLRLQCAPGTRIADLGGGTLEELVAEHKVVVIRGLELAPKRELPAEARQLGPLMPWSFGAINELRVDPEAENYLFTNGAVPLHWDGAFAGVTPRYLFFQCVSAPSEGDDGRTVFFDARGAIAKLSNEERASWPGQAMRYETEKLTHYGGRFDSPLIVRDSSGAELLRTAEPVTALNPVTVTPLDHPAPEELRARLDALLSDESLRLAHAWRSGDYLIADNTTLLHGREAFADGGARHLRRINVLARTRPAWRWLWDSLRIRRPEFMVAEVPILLIATLLCAPTTEVLSSPIYAEAVVAFFLMFHFGDIVNCLADRDLDALYKTKLSEAVYGLGVGNVRLQLAGTTALALALALDLGARLDRPWLPLLMAAGLAWGAQYSVGPLRFKGRGLWQVVTLIGIIFVGPMLFIGCVVSAEPSLALVTCALLYGVMQEGTILINTAEDYAEDLDHGIRTSAVALGPHRTVALSFAMVAGGGGGLLTWLGLQRAPETGLAGLCLLALSLCWVLADIGALGLSARGHSVSELDPLLKRWAARMPLWITALAWTTLLGVWQGFPWS